MEDFLTLTNIEANCYCMDKHPNYPQKDWIGETDIPVLEVWHHHAHFVSCIADNDLPLEDDYIGVILDGTGYGKDGKIWGFEWIVGNVHTFERAAHVQYELLPGGEQAIREPWRQAVAWLIKALDEKGKEIAFSLFPDKELEIPWIERMIHRKLGTIE